MVKIGIDARLTYYRPGGIAEYTRQLIRALTALDHNTCFCIIQHHRDTNTLAQGPNIRRIDTITPSHHRLERWSLSAELARHRLDLLHSPDMIPPQHGARRQVITVHDVHFLHYDQFMTADSRRHYNEQITRAVRVADHILVSSHATQDDLTNLLHVPPEKMTVHMLGVDDVFQPLPDDVVRQIRVQLGLPELYILFVGTFEPRKNIPGLLEAYARLRHDLPDVPPLVLAGRRGWLYEDIFQSVEALKLADAIIWLENAPFAALPAIYNGAVVLVLPSFYEGFGLTALEAMACGTPTIVSNRSSLPEVVGDAGQLVNPDDPDDIAHTIRRVLLDSDLHRGMRSAGLARAATFTWQRTAETALAVYREAVVS